MMWAWTSMARAARALELLVIPRSLVYNAIRSYRIMSRSQWTKKSSGARGRTGADVAIQASHVPIAARAARRARRRRPGRRDRSGVLCDHARPAARLGCCAPGVARSRGLGGEKDRGPSAHGHEAA